MKTLRRTVSDGVVSLYDVDFELGYFERTHVFVYAGDDHTLPVVELSYVWQNDTQIELTVPEEYTAGTVINIRRIVPRDTLYVTFKNSTGLTEKSLNAGNAQALMLIEEQDDGFKPTGFYEKQDLLFGGIYTCKELKDGVDDQDAVTMKQVFSVDEGFLGTFVAACTVQADRSETEANRAEDAADSIDVSTFVSQTSATGAARIPSGPTGERDPSPVIGDTRYDTTEGVMHVFGTTGWETTGGGSGLVWQAITEEDVAATAGKGYNMDNSAGSNTITLPTTPTRNDQIGYKDAGSVFSTYPLEFDLNGNLVEGMDSFRVNGRGAGGTLIWSGDVTIGWLLINGTPVVHTLPITNAHVTGNIFGGELEYLTASTFNVKAVSCIADDAVTPLVINATTLKNLTGAAINTIYNIFLVKYTGGTFGIEYDTDVTGAGLVATVVQKRWIGFVRTGASGSILPFIMQGDEVVFSQSSLVDINSFTIASAGCSTELDISDWLPSYTRVSHVMIGVKGDLESAAQVTIGFDGTNAFHGGSGRSFYNEDSGGAAWMNDGWNIWMPIASSSIYWGRGTQSSVTKIKLLFHGARLRR